MDVQINKSEWDGLSADDKDKIQKIIESHFKDTNIVGDAASPSVHEVIKNHKALSFNLSNPFCSAACGVAEAAAAAACSALSGGIAIAACVAAAHGAGEICRSRC